MRWEDQLLTFENNFLELNNNTGHDAEAAAVMAELYLVDDQEDRVLMPEVMDVVD